MLHHLYFQANQNLLLSLPTYLQDNIHLLNFLLFPHLQRNLPETRTRKQQYLLQIRLYPLRLSSNSLLNLLQLLLLHQDLLIPKHHNKPVLAAIQLVPTYPLKNFCHLLYSLHFRNMKNLLLRMLPYQLYLWIVFLHSIQQAHHRILMVLSLPLTHCRNE